MIAGTINNTLKAKDPTKTTTEDSVKTAEDSTKTTTEDSVKTAENLVKTKGPMWKKEDLGTQIRSFEYQISGIMEKVRSYES
ncbi:MAG: hypothetical protein RBR63_09385 [Methanosarcina vacuolata]|jgi:hypothetical protein|nr:hypothetical protein [Methanosarcina vacuolata]